MDRFCVLPSAVRGWPRALSAGRGGGKAGMGMLATARPSQRSRLRDLACAAVYAICKRDGGSDGRLRDRGISCKPGYLELRHARAGVGGDGRAWDDVMSVLGEILRTKVSAGTPRSDQALTAIEYLARHAEPGIDRPIRLVTPTRDRWHSTEPNLENNRYAPVAAASHSGSRAIRCLERYSVQPVIAILRCAAPVGRRCWLPSRGAALSVLRLSSQPRKE
jgi:hypothetical protein